GTANASFFQRGRSRRNKGWTRGWGCEADGFARREFDTGSRCNLAIGSHLCAMDRGARRSFLVGAGASNPRMRRKAPALLPGEGRNQKHPFGEKHSGG